MLVCPGVLVPAWAPVLQQNLFPGKMGGGYASGCTTEGGPLTQLRPTTPVPAEQTAVPRDQQHDDDAGMGSAGQLHGAADLMHTENCLALQQGMETVLKESWKGTQTQWCCFATPPTPLSLASAGEHWAL